MKYQFGSNDFQVVLGHLIGTGNQPPAGSVDHIHAIETSGLDAARLANLFDALSGPTAQNPGANPLFSNAARVNPPAPITIQMIDAVLSGNAGLVPPSPVHPLSATLLLHVQAIADVCHGQQAIVNAATNAVVGSNLDIAFNNIRNQNGNNAPNSINAIHNSAKNTLLNIAGQHAAVAQHQANQAAIAQQDPLTNTYLNNPANAVGATPGLTNAQKINNTVSAFIDAMYRQIELATYPDSTVLGYSEKQKDINAVMKGLKEHGTQFTLGQVAGLSAHFPVHAVGQLLGQLNEFLDGRPISLTQPSAADIAAAAANAALPAPVATPLALRYRDGTTHNPDPNLIALAQAPQPLAVPPVLGHQGAPTQADQAVAKKYAKDSLVEYIDVSQQALIEKKIIKNQKDISLINEDVEAHKARKEKFEERREKTHTKESIKTGADMGSKVGLYGGIVAAIGFAFATGGVGILAAPFIVGGSWLAGKAMGAAIGAMDAARKKDEFSSTAKKEEKLGNERVEQLELRKERVQELKQDALDFGVDDPETLGRKSPPPTPKTTHSAAQKVR